MTFGHEVAGRIAAVGPEVHHPDVGAFVAAETHLFCGHCRMCRTGRAHICENLRILGVDVDGAFADYVVIPAVNAWEVDPRIPAESASIMEPFGNAVHTVFSGGGEDVELGDRRRPGLPDPSGCSPSASRARRARARSSPSSRTSTGSTSRRRWAPTS